MIFGHFALKVEMAIGEVNAHIFGCSETKEAILIDAGKDDPAFEAFLRLHDAHLKAVFLTHDHEDHVAGAAECARHYNAQIIAGYATVGGAVVDRVVKHGDEIKVGNITGRVVETSGHTPLGLSLLFPGMAFTGDALFAGSVGGTGTKDAYNKQIRQIREHLFTLPDYTEVHSGHGPATTIGIEKKYNPFFV